MSLSSSPLSYMFLIDFPIDFTMDFLFGPNIISRGGGQEDFFELPGSRTSALT